MTDARLRGHSWTTPVQCSTAAVLLQGARTGGLLLVDGRRVFGESVRITDSSWPFLLAHPRRALFRKDLKELPLRCWQAVPCAFQRCHACRICQSSCGAHYNDVGVREMRDGLPVASLVKATTHIHLRFSVCQINPCMLLEMF